MKNIITYDDRHDLLIMKDESIAYEDSVECDAIVLDFGSKGQVSGFRFFDAAKLLGIPKKSVKEAQKVSLDALDSLITVRLTENGRTHTFVLEAGKTLPAIKFTGKRVAKA